jgi:hypothetical protein
VILRGNSSVQLASDAVDGVMSANFNMLVLSGLAPAPAAYSGQFLQLDLVSVLPLQGSCAVANVPCPSTQATPKFVWGPTWGSVFVSSTRAQIVKSSKGSFCLSTDTEAFVQTSADNQQLWAWDMILVQVDGGPLKVYGLLK